ncbi:MAG: ABC transporter ATP-binding protein [Planctomycetota bacterium]
MFFRRLNALRPNFRRYSAYFWRERWWMLLGTLCLVPASIINLQIPWIIKDAIDNIGKKPAAEYLYTTVVVYLALAFAKGVLRYGMRWFLVTSSRRVEANIRNDLFRHLETLSFPYFNKTKTGDIISRATQDVEAVRMFLGPGYMYITDALVQIPVAIYLLFHVQPIMFVAIAISLGVLAISVKILTPKLHKYSEAQQKSIGDLSDKANETFAGTRLLKAFAREEAAIHQFDEVSKRYKKNSLDFISVQALSSVFFSGAKELTLLILFIVGGILYFMGQTSVGELYLFADYTARLYWPVFVLGWMVSMYPRAVAASKRLEEIFTTKPEVADGPRTDITNIGGSIEFRDVTFSYAPDRAPVLKNLSFHVHDGETVAFVGKTAAGKTTMIQLLGRFFTVPSGKIFVGGVDICDLPVRTLRNAFGYVPQDHFLFSDSIAENIAFSGEQPDLERAAWAAEQACLNVDLQQFPNGLQTEIGERGITLSGGQRQRVAIARAIYANPTILILDDSLSAVDVATENRLVLNLKEIAKGRTTVFVAHRLSTVRHADRIFVMDHGRIAESGSHDELLKRRGLYADLWQMQQIEQSLEQEAGP